MALCMAPSAKLQSSMMYKVLNSSLTFSRKLLTVNSNVKASCLSSSTVRYSKITSFKVFSCSISSSTQEKLQNVNEEEFRLIYEGPLSRQIKLIKVLSMMTATASLTAGPLFVLYGKESVPFIGKMILAASVITMGVTTTMLLHWVTRVYVHKMLFHPQTRTFSAETYNLFGQVRQHQFSVSDIVLPEVESAFSTFQANGQNFFVHTDMKEAEQIMKYVREYNTEELS